MRANDDLPWLWGTGAQTAIGDCGLRSPLGGQLARAYDRVSGRPSFQGSNDDDARVAAASRIRRIEERLKRLPADVAAHLWVHFSQPSLPFGLSAAAVFTRSAASLIGESPPSPQELRDKLRKMNARDDRFVGLEKQTKELVDEAVLAYDELPDEAKKASKRHDEAWQKGRRKDAADAMLSEHTRSASVAPDEALEAKETQKQLDARLVKLTKMIDAMKRADRLGA